jgi:hypothetical protein
MRQRIGSVYAQRASRDAAMRTDRAADGAPRHRPRRGHGLSPEQESVLDLQRLAGNAAVAKALADGRASGLVTSVDAMELTREGMGPEAGITGIRDHTSNKSAIALTQRGIRDDPPIMRAEPPTKTAGGYTTRAHKVDSIPEPMIKEWWPTTGPHKIAEGSYLDVEGDWEKKLEKGEDEHASDAKLSWELTWKKTQATINSLAEKPGPAESTSEGATKALWRRYVAALPKDLQPEGDTPSDAKQRDILAVRPGTFFAWMWEITVARDGRMYHETKTVPSTSAKAAPKNAIVQQIAGFPQFLVPGPKSEDFIEEIRKKYTPGKIIQGSKLKAGDDTGKGG